MKLFPRKKKKHAAPNRYRISYVSKTGSSHYTMVLAKDTTLAKNQFMTYYGSPGDEVIDVALDAEKVGL